MRKALFLATLALSLAASAGERSRGEMRSVAQRYLPAAAQVKGQGGGGHIGSQIVVVVVVVVTTVVVLWQVGG